MTKNRKDISIYFNIKYYSFFQLLKYFVCVCMCKYVCACVLKKGGRRFQRKGFKKKGVKNTLARHKIFAAR